MTRTILPRTNPSQKDSAVRGDVKDDS